MVLTENSIVKMQKNANVESNLRYKNDSYYPATGREAPETKMGFTRRNWVFLRIGQLSLKMGSAAFGV